MEVNNIARDLVRRSRSAHSLKTNIFLFSILIIISSLALFLFYPKDVKAYSQPTMSITQAQLILDTFKNKEDFIYSNNYTSLTTNEEAIQTIQNISASDFANKFNTRVQSQISYDFNWDDVSIIGGKNVMNLTSFHGFTFIFVISPNNYNNLTLTFDSDRNQYKINNNYKFIALQYRLDTGATYYASGTDFFTYPKRIPETNDSLLIINNFNFCVGINNDKHIKYNNFDYTIASDILYFTNNGGIVTPEIISGDIESSYGYFFYENDNISAIPINIENNIPYYKLDEFWYIGNDLNYTYNYYYYSGDTKVSINNLITLNQWTNSGDTGKFYEPKIYTSDYWQLPNNTGFYLDINCELNGTTETIIQDFYSFYTYSEVVDSGQTGTITITNGSGDVSSGEIDLSGIQAGINNTNNFLNQNIDNNKSGEIENALNIDMNITDPTADFFTWFFNQLKDCFTVNTAQTLTFTILNNQFSINSDNYILDIPLLNNVLGLGSGIFILYGIFKDIRKEIEKVKEGKFEEVGKEDISANML